MADFPGILDLPILAPQHPGISPNLSTVTPGTAGPRRAPLVTLSLSGARAAGTPQTFAQALVGSLALMYGGELFEKIIVTPRTKDLGFVLSTVLFDIDVWNTFRNALQEMTAIDITGSGGLIVTNPFGLPLSFAAVQSRTFEGQMPQAGDAQILNTAVFVFTGISGTDLLVEGTRLVVFSPDADWGEPIRERSQYLTLIVEAHSQKEQRAQLRVTPRPILTYRVLTLTRKDTAALDALLWGWQAKIYGVPMWMDAQPLLADAPPDSTVLQVSTTFRRFQAGGLMMFWRDMHTHEALKILSLLSGSITLTSPTIQNWLADGRTYVVPLLMGRLPSELTVRRPNNQSAELEAQFVCEVA